MKKVAIVQARSTSTRLPGKCLFRLFGKPVLRHILERIQRVSLLEGICLATTENVSDDALVDIAREMEVPFYRGSEQDVLDRFHKAAMQEQADIVCRITADDPLKDPDVIENILREHIGNGCDYTSNTLEPTYPEGLDVEVFSFHALETAWKEGYLPSEREHVTPYLWKNPKKFKLCNVRYDRDLSEHRWTLDYAEDWVFIQQVYEFLYPEKKNFSMQDVLQLMEEKPYLRGLNAGIVRNEGYKKSLKEDKDGAGI